MRSIKTHLLYDFEVARQETSMKSVMTNKK